MGAAAILVQEGVSQAPVCGRTVSVRMTTVEIDNVLATPELHELFESAEQNGSLRYADLVEVLLERIDFLARGIEAGFHRLVVFLHRPGRVDRADLGRPRHR